MNVEIKLNSISKGSLRPLLFSSATISGERIIEFSARRLLYKLDKFDAEVKAFTCYFWCK